MDLATVAGTGPSGRITASDVERAAKGGAAPAAPAAAAPAAAAAAPAAAAPAAAAPKAPAAAAGTTVSELRGTTKPFTTLQAAVARNMNESLKVRPRDERCAWKVAIGRALSRRLQVLEGGQAQVCGGHAPQQVQGAHIQLQGTGYWESPMFSSPHGAARG